MKKLIYLQILAIIAFSCSESNDEPKVKLETPPVILQGTLASNSGFTANWSALEGAESYKIDVSESPRFETLISGYDAHVVAETSVKITGIDAAAKKFYYRVKAVNGLGETAYSQIACSKEIDKALLYNKIWVYDTNKSDESALKPMNLSFDADGVYKSYVAGHLMTTTTYTWKSGDTVAILFGQATHEIRFVDIGTNYYLAYFSTQIKGLTYFNKQ